MPQEKIAGVIVTYNRKELLSLNLQSQKIQTRLLDVIFIVDNGGDDGTKHYLEEKGLLTPQIVYLRLEQNIGCAGAFKYGMKQAVESGFDWVYVMDDDGRPQDKDTIQNLICEVYAMGLTGENLVIANSLVLCENNLLAFKIFESFDLNLVKKKAGSSSIILNEAKLWNGSLISRAVFCAIGYPNENFYFKGEEIDFKKRALRGSARVFTCLNSKYVHPAIKEKEFSFGRKKVYFSIEPDWKYFYLVRNYTYMLKKERKFLRMIMYYFKCLYCIQKITDKEKEKATRKLIKLAFYNGAHGILGKGEF